MRRLEWLKADSVSFRKLLEEYGICRYTTPKQSPGRQGALHQFMASAAAGYDDEELRGRAALREAFGDSSDSEPDAAREEDTGAPVGRGRWRWDAVAGVRGLWLCAAFLYADEQSRLLAAIQREGWFIDAHNQAMRFGDLPPWAVELSALVREAICVGDVNVDVGPDSSEENEDSCPLPSDLLWREPLFDQLIANRYKPGYLCSC